jgi:hypothetical protein
LQYDCICASFEYDNTQYAWWNDRDGNAQYFWAGNKTNGIHTCQCGIDKNCVDSSLKCNCDQASQDELVDEGKFKYHFPLTITFYFKEIGFFPL